VATRALAVYQVGNVRYPGLSDLDLLIVVSDSRADNQQFFSVYNSLPKRFQQLFLHEPFVVPYDCLDCMQFTSHTSMRLLGGRDLASGLLPDTSKGEQWCRLLEGLCTYHSYFAHVAKTATIRVRHMTAVASSMRFTLAQFDAIQGSELAAQYSRQLDTFRSAFLADYQSQTLASQVFEYFFEAFQALEQTLQTRLPLAPNEEPTDFAKRFLAGERALPEVSAPWLRRRSQAIARYHQALNRLKMPYGYLFFLAAYSDSVNPYRQSRLTAKYFNAYYGVRNAFERLIPA